MKVYICDHCKKSITEIDKIKVLYKQWVDDKEPREYGDICTECFWKLEQWLGVERKKWMTYYNEKVKPGMSLEEIDEAYT